MTKLRGANTTQSQVPRVHGQIVTALTARGPVAKAWPPKRGKSKTPGDWYHRTEFGIAAQWASDPEPIMWDSAVALCEGTDNVPRDLLMMCMYGTYYRITLPDGTPVPSYRSVTANAQFVLDQITNTPGSMLWRSPSGWVELVIGNNGQVITVDNAQPKWVSLQHSAGGAAGISAPYIADADTYITPAVLGSSSFLNVPTNGTQLWCVPISFPWDIAATKFVVSLGSASGTPTDTGRIGLYNLNTLTGGPGDIYFDAGTVNIGSTGLKTATVSTVIRSGTYFIAWWPQGNCQPRGVSGATGVAANGVQITGGGMNRAQCLRTAVTYGATWPDLTAVAMALVAPSDGYPVLGVK